MWFLGFSVFFFLLYWLFNSRSVWINDDYTYRLVFEYWRVSANPAKVSSLHDIYVGMINHYMHWGGRIPVHTAVQLLLWLVDKRIFDALNALVAVALGVLTYYHINFGRKRSLLLYAAVFTLIFFTVPQPEMTLFNPTNSVNNMWAFVYLLAFLVPYRVLAVRQTPFRRSALLLAAMVPLGILAGWSNEPGGAAAGSFAVFICVYLLKTGKRPPAWAYTGIASLAAGWAVMVFAPGYRMKARDYYSVPSVIKYALGHFGVIIKNLLSDSWAGLWHLLVLVTVLSSVLYFLLKKSHARSRLKPSLLRRQILKEFSMFPAVLYLAGALVSLLIYIIAPEFVPRYLFPASIFLIIAAGLIALRIFEVRQPGLRAARAAAAAVLCVCIASVAADAVYEYGIVSYNYQLSTAITDDISSQVERGQKNLVVKGSYAFLSTGRFSSYRYDFIDMEVLWGGKETGGEINRLIAANFGAATFSNQADMRYTREK